MHTRLRGVPLVLLVLVLLAWVGSGCSAPAAEPEPEPAAEPTAAEPAAEPSAAAPTTIHVSELPTGPPPRVAYLDAGVLHRPDGRRAVTATTRSLSSFGAVGELVLGVANGESLVRIVMDRTGHRLSSGPGGSRVLASPDGSLLGWLQADSWTAPLTPVLYAGDGRSWSFPALRADENLVGFAGSRDCDGTRAAACLAYVVRPASGDERGSSAAVGLDGTRIPLGVGTQVTDVSARGEVAGWIRPRSLGRHNDAALWSRSGELLWRARDCSLAAFSPRGRHIAGQDDGLGTGSITVFSRRGAREVVLTLGEGYWVDRFVWEDERHLVALVARHAGQAPYSRQAVLRVDLDGHVELALAPRRVAEVGSPVLLSAG